MPPQPKTHTITISNITYHTLQEGPPNRPLILLTHALMSNLHMWDSTVSALHAANYQTLRFDHIGHNLTTSPPPPTSEQPYTCTTDEITEHMHLLLQTVTAQPNPNLKAVIGCSIGGVLALRYGMLHPKHVETVISLCAPGIKSQPESHALWDERISQFESDVAALPQRKWDLAQATVARWIPGSSREDEVAREEALEQVKTCSLQGYRALAGAIRGYDYSSGEDLGKLGGADGPGVVVVAGGRDSSVRPGVLRELAGGIEGARYCLMEDAGHLPPVHRKGEWEALLLGVLEG